MRIFLIAVLTVIISPLALFAFTPDQWETASAVRAAKTLYLEENANEDYRLVIPDDKAQGNETVFTLKKLSDAEGVTVFQFDQGRVMLCEENASPAWVKESGRTNDLVFIRNKTISTATGELFPLSKRSGVVVAGSVDDNTFLLEHVNGTAYAFSHKSAPGVYQRILLNQVSTDGRIILKNDVEKSWAVVITIDWNESGKAAGRLYFGSSIHPLDCSYFDLRATLRDEKD